MEQSSQRHLTLCLLHSAEMSRRSKISTWALFEEYSKLFLQWLSSFWIIDTKFYFCLILFGRNEPQNFPPHTNVNWIGYCTALPWICNSRPPFFFVKLRDRIIFVYLCCTHFIFHPKITLQQPSNIDQSSQKTIDAGLQRKAYLALCLQRPKKLRSLVSCLYCLFVPLLHVYNGYKYFGKTEEVPQMGTNSNTNAFCDIIKGRFAHTFFKKQKKK